MFTWGNCGETFLFSLRQHNKQDLEISWRMQTLEKTTRSPSGQLVNHVERVYRWPLFTLQLCINKHVKQINERTSESKEMKKLEKVGQSKTTWPAPSDQKMARTWVVDEECTLWLASRARLWLRARSRSLYAVERVELEQWVESVLRPQTHPSLAHACNVCAPTRLFVEKFSRTVEKVDRIFSTLCTFLDAGRHLVGRVWFFVCAAPPAPLL